MALPARRLPGYSQLVRPTGVWLAVIAVLVCAPVAGADEWLPHSTDATWTYEWKDSSYSPTPTKEKFTVKNNAGSMFTLAWTTDGLDNSPDAVTSSGTVRLQET